MDSGTVLVSTPGYRTVAFCVREAVRAKGICLVTGQPGLGKTFATRDILHSVAPDLDPDTVLRQERFPRSPSAKRIAERLLFAVTGETALRRTEEAITRDLVEALQRPTILFIDEAQNLTAHGMHYLRYLWDEPGTNVTIVLVGKTETFKLINRDSTLRSRVFAHASIKPLTAEEALEFVPKLHPIWADTSVDTIKFINSSYARGNMRSWVIFTRWADSFCQQEGSERVSRETAEKVFVLVKSLRADEE